MAKKQIVTENEIIRTPAGGVLIGKDKEGQTIIPNDGSMGGFLVGRLHKDGGIKAVNKSNGQPLEVQGNEVIITSPAVADTQKKEFEGKMMTNREILSKINSDAGGVKFDEGGEVKAKTNGHLAKNKSLPQIAKIHDVSMEHLMKQVKLGLKVESEHTSDEKEQIKIVKDHLLENPSYYTILEKAGLAKGGLIAPNGKESNLTAKQYELVRTKEFKVWFGDWEKDPKNASKVVDENGEPLVVYHGTNYDFNSFNENYKAHYFSVDKKYADFVIDNYRGRKDYSKVISYFLNIRKLQKVKFPIEKNTIATYLNDHKFLKEIDGGIFGLDDIDEKEINKIENIDTRVYVVLNPNQIKLADGTNTTFSSNNNDIRFKTGGQVKENLSKDAKDGNTPARDLNNYNDLMDVQADGEVGGLTGIDMDGTGGMDASSGVGAFAYGGDIKNSNKKKSFESEGSTEGKGKLYEFFTPQIVADKMLALAQHYGFKGGNVLEPATGSGRLIKNLKDTNITAFEISKDNFEILQKEFPNAELYNFNFEKAFLKEPRFNTLLNRKGTETWLKNAPFDLVIANPPYGKFSGLYSSYFKFKGQVEHFFILQTLYLLKKGGLGVYLIPSSFMRNGISYNDIKKEIFEIAELVDAYRLPSNIFEKTQIGTDILILRKK